MDLTTATPVEIDTALAEIYTRYYAKRDEVDRVDLHIADMVQGIEKFEAGNTSYSAYTHEALGRLRAKRADLRKQADEIIVESFPYEQAFIRRGGWSRFFLVKNNGGHIHSSMNCSTCFPTTQFGWLPEISGQNEAEAVAAHGAILCTVCYPSAPVEYTDRRDDSVCPGSGQYYNSDLPHRGPHFASGNWATCGECGESQTMMRSGKIRKHKKP